jgi:hypothetical protein
MCACAFSIAWAYEEAPQAGTVTEQKWYTINSKARGGCLTVTHNGALQHIAETPLTSYWRIVIPDDNTDGDLSAGVYVRNFNGKYLTVAEVSDTPTKVYIGKSRESGITDNYFVICKAQDTNTEGQPSADCIDANNYNTGVGSWVGATIEGYSWGFSLVEADKLPVVPEVSTADAPKYYKVVSNRGIYGDGFSDGPYMKVDSETASTSAIDEQTGIGALGNGSYWRLAADDDGAAEIGGGVYLHNLISDQVFTPGVPTTMTGSGTKVYLANITGKTKSEGSNQIFDLNTYAISKTELVNGEPDGNNCMDQSNLSPYPEKFEWHPYLKEDNGDTNNGSSWYFLSATADEVTAAEQGYINSLQVAKPDAVAAYVTPLTYCTNLSAIFDADKVKALQEKVDSYCIDLSGVTTVLEAITALREYKANNTEVDSDALATLLKEVYNSAIGKMLQFNMQGSTTYLGVNVADGATGMWGYGNGRANVKTIWRVDAGDSDGHYRLYNYGTNKYAGKRDFEQGKQVPVVASSSDAYTQYSFIQGGSVYNNGYENMVRIFNNTSEGDGNKAYFYCNGADRLVSIWGNGHNNTVWGVAAVQFDSSVTASATVEDRTVTLNTADDALAGGVDDAAISITATKMSTEEGIAAIDDDDDEPETTISDDGVASLTFDNYGTYTITIPAGYYVTEDGVFSAEQTIVVTLSETTSISEVEQAAPAAPAAIYDLQGRRVERTSRGLYIVNGRKTLVK